ncbi:MAG: class I adenylate-forming enzyme family protein [Thermodesulfobacteriota bacterium]
MANGLVHEFLEQSAKRYPGKTALVHDTIRATYAEINRRADRLAAWLVGQGIATGDRVALLLQNGLPYVVSYYAVLKAGGVAVPLATEIKPDGLKPLLADLQPRYLITAARFESIVEQVDLSVGAMDGLVIQKPQTGASRLPVKCHCWDEIAADGDAAPVNRSVSPADLASIVYTSGSTGTPKGVMLTHRNIVANTASICRYLNLTEADVQMVVLPFFYVMGKSLLNTHFRVGGTVVINNGFAFPAAVLHQMAAERVTGFSGVPATYAHLLHRSPLAQYREKLEALRYCSQAGGHMAKTVKRQLRAVLPAHTRIFIMYGASEATARLTYLPPERFEDKMDSIGRPIDGVSVRILDKAGNPVPQGHTGELVAAGDNIMAGYWRDPDATARVLDDKGYHTGDIGYADAEGFLYITARKDRLVKVGGHRINPQEIEDALVATELVMETVVVAVPDDLLGHRLVALAIAGNGDCCEADILNRCAQILPRYKLPSRITLVRSLPRTGSGKIDPVRCMEMVGA